jgi:FkbM family methyltransferase
MQYCQSARIANSAMAPLKQFAFLTCVSVAYAAQLRNSTQKVVLRGSQNSSASSAHRTAPCQCEANNPAWVACTRTQPKCVFIDLGAADGNSFKHFLNNGYGPIANCPSGGQWEAYLVEANPQFTPALNALAAAYPGSVHAHGSTAAYSCQGQTSFSIDPDAGHNHWGSSMKRQFGSQTVTVPTINVMQVVQEHAAMGDYVMLKVDIEGAEYDLMPCLAQYTNIKLLDAVYLEEHGYLQADSVYTAEQYQAAKMQLKAAGINMPDNYHSQTL